MDNVNALKALYVALGGNADTVANISLISDMINAIAGIIAGGTLPAVTAADNGKILTVVSGKWAAETPTPANNT